MPGRQAHGRPLLADPNKKRKGARKHGGGNGGSSGSSGSAAFAGRSSGGAPRTRQGGRVDVMALAEQQIGESRAKGVRVRDLEIERDQGKRRRNDEDDQDEDDQDGEEEAPKRRRPNDDKDDGDDSSDELHSDSSGNEWREGVGSDDDDSEIDSDEAFGDSDDDEIFDAFTFRGSSSKQNKNKKGKTRKSEEFDGFDDDEDMSDEDIGDDGADLGDEAIDLAAALDIVSSDDDEAQASSGKNDKARSKTKRQPDMGNSSASDASMSGSDSDDDDSDSDSEQSAASSDLESDEGDEEEEEEDDDTDEDTGFSKSDALRSIASAYAAGGGNGSDSDGDDDVAHAANPYQFNAFLGSKDRSLKKSIKAAAAESSEKKLNVPLLPMQHDRQLRVAAAEKAHETLDRWTDTVKHNRRAEHLEFQVAGSLATSGLDTTSLMPIGQNSAQTELEKTILSIMEESGLGARAQAEKRAEQKKLERAQAEAQLSPEALKAIIGQKRRARELQSREQARAKRIKKIKSKAYRRVHRRERQRAEDALDDSDAEHDSDEEKDSEAEREAAHRRRAMERMGSRHRDSRWAKRAKNTNRAAWDDEFRSGLVDMARQDEELRRRVDGAGVGGGKAGKADGSDESDSDSLDDSDDEAFKLRMKNELASSGGAGQDGEPKGLMAIAFMKKAEQARKKANDDAVAEIMRDLDRGDDSDDDAAQFGENTDSQDNGEKAVGRRSYGPKSNDDKPDGASRLPSQKMAGALREDTTLFTAETATPSSKPKHAKDISSALPARKASAPGDAGSWTVVGTSGTSDKKKSKKIDNSNAGATAGLTSDGRLMMSAVVDNVLAQNKAADDVAAAREAVRKSAASKRSAVQAAGESETSSSGSDSEEDADDADHRTASRGKYFKFRAESNQLLSKVLGEDDAEAEFAAEKAAQALEEAAAWDDQQARASGRKDKNAAVMPGWGSWVGDGVSKRAVKRDQRVIAAAGTKGGKDKSAADKKALIRRDAKLDKVIISEKRTHKNDKYLASQLPHEYETRMQYERSLRLPVGPEWSTMFAFQDATKPRLIKKQGVVLPMAKPRI
ncbi:hypothetical protein SEPCBS119000_001222 [Sporothrix epigloea]|uniref:Uncharacterized protein n=1 Tax=Sporothrix epigloea TaxID=1892477 RepID=A0ABP0DBY3_9PEZI